MKNAENRKQLDLNDRITIETGIYLKESFTSFAKKLHVHPSTISREVQSIKPVFQAVHLYHYLCILPYPLSLQDSMPP